MDISVKSLIKMRNFRQYDHKQQQQQIETTNRNLSLENKKP